MANLSNNTKRYIVGHKRYNNEVTNKKKKKILYISSSTTYIINQSDCLWIHCVQIKVREKRLLVQRNSTSFFYRKTQYSIWIKFWNVVSIIHKKFVSISSYAGSNGEWYWMIYGLRVFQFYNRVYNCTMWVKKWRQYPISKAIRYCYFNSLYSNFLIAKCARVWIIMNKAEVNSLLKASHWSTHWLVFFCCCCCCCCCSTFFWSSDHNPSYTSPLAHRWTPWPFRLSSDHCYNHIIIIITSSD